MIFEPTYHQPVMVDKVIQELQVKPEQYYIDATLGTGGHSKALLEKGAKVIGFDQDEQAIQISKERLKHKQITFINQNFNNILSATIDLGIRSVSGILFDLGTSAIQLETPGRGFSFSLDEPLDMRMSKELSVSAKDLVNGLSQKELHVLLTKYAQEQRARSISQAIVSARRLKPIQTTGELANICMQAYHGQRGKLHPATKTFQALRMAVNDEINILKDTLPQTIQLLDQQGKLAVISFHEGEDRLVKNFIKETPRLRATYKKPLTPTPQEIQTNPRARSAKLRIAEKIS